MDKKRCVNCNKIFYKNSTSSYHWNKKRFCSKKCQNNHRSLKCVCRNCKKIFYIRKRDINIVGRGQFCSKRCSAIHGGQLRHELYSKKVKCFNCKRVCVWDNKVLNYVDTYLNPFTFIVDENNIKVTYCIECWADKIPNCSVL